ncbi:MAG TPA: histidinol dehydrogenase [Candidatus Omnitrophota bacterium]|nr:histidinol dehydrogenase [Candidatus Omnitrophota bacterium]
MKILRSPSTGLERLCDRNLYARKKHIEEKVRRIIDDIKINGDEAVLKYTRRFDNVKLTQKQIRVAEAEISGAFQNITSEFVGTLKLIINNVSRFYEKQLKKPRRVKNEDGVLLKEKILPLDSVGVYIPAGTAPLVSSVYMTVIPAKIAGVKRIVLVAPPDKTGHINPYILAVANLLKVDEIYKIGGAQAIAALALGTKTIPKVDKIIGPGNMYVTEAKRQLFGYVDIDMLAGPSELAIIASRNSNPAYILADLESQAEHVGGLAILITTSRKLVRQLKKHIPNGYIVYVKNIDEAIDVANKIAPEHLQILSNNAVSIASRIKHAGAIFLGPFSPTAVGDYIAGPSHVLPTMGTARFFSGICLSDFTKTSHIICYSKKALERIRDPLEKVALLEGLKKHNDSIQIRFQ